MQAGDPLKAMKALLHTGEQDRILRFATASRSPQIFLLAAQWMQASVSWLNDDVPRKQARCYLYCTALYFTNLNMVQFCSFAP